MIPSPSRLAKYFRSSRRPLLEVTVHLCQIQKRTNTRQDFGICILTILPSPESISFSIAKPKSPPIVLFSLNRKLDVTFPAPDIWGIVEPNGQRWLLKFKVVNDSYRALAVLGLIFAGVDAGMPVPWEPPNQKCQGKEIIPGDTVRFSLNAFAVEEFPWVGGELARHVGVVQKLVLKPGIPNLFDLMLGARCGCRRVVYIADGADARMPKGAVVFVARVAAAGGDSAALGEESEYDDEEEEANVPEPNVEEPKGLERTGPAVEVSEPNVEEARVLEQKEVEERELTEEEKEANRKESLRKRMQRLGQAAAGMGGIVVGERKSDPGGLNSLSNGVEGRARRGSENVRNSYGARERSTSPPPQGIFDMLAGDAAEQSRDAVVSSATPKGMVDLQVGVAVEQPRKKVVSSTISRTGSLDLPAEQTESRVSHRRRSAGASGVPKGMFDLGSNDSTEPPKRTGDEQQRQDIPRSQPQGMIDPPAAELPKRTSSEQQRQGSSGDAPNGMVDPPTGGPPKKTNGQHNRRQSAGQNGLFEVPVRVGGPAGRASHKSRESFGEETVPSRPRILFDIPVETGQLKKPSAGRARSQDIPSLAGGGSTTLKDRLDRLDRFARRIDALTQPVSLSQEDLVSGVQLLAAGLQTSRSEIERLRSALAEVKRQKQVEEAATQLFESVKKELADARQLNEDLTRRAKETAKQLRDVESELSVATDRTQNGATTLIRGLMDSVFQDMVREFPTDERFTGAEVAAQLEELLKVQSGQALTFLSENGLG
jgi:hypothetical protein